MPNSEKVLYVLTQGYPIYNGTEPFFTIEEEILRDYFSFIYFLPVTIKNLPIKRDDVVRITPISNHSKFKTLLSYLGIIFRYTDMRSILPPNFFIKRLREIFIEYSEMAEIRQAIVEIVKKNKENKCFLAYWLSTPALILAYLKEKKIINRFAVRAHGYDVFSERGSHYWLPFLKFVLKNATSIVCDSHDGANHLRKRYPKYAEKIHGVILGHNVSPNIMNPFIKEDFYHIVSVSLLKPIKRVYLIAEALTYSNLPIKWTHLGGSLSSDACEVNKIKAVLSRLPSNVKVDFRGYLPNEKIHEFYKNEPVHCFVMVSSHEGSPYALKEALAYGIPVIATNTGGIPELVNEYTGILLSKDPSPLEIYSTIASFLLSDKNSEKFRIGVKKFYIENIQKVMKERYYSALIHPLIQ